MRRPSPLPPPPARGGADTAAPPRSPGAEPAGSEDGPADPEEPIADLEGASAEGDLTAPVIPLAPLAPPTPLPLVDGAGSAGPAASEDAVGLREVWRAARARRRALRAEVRRFTARQRRRRAVWIGVGASVLVLALATLGAAYSPLFAVEDIRIVGIDRLDEADVAAALDDQIGTPLPLVDESAIKAALITFPLVESYTLEARPPHGLVVRIVERTPIGLVKTRAGYTLVDAAGVALSTSAKRTDGVPLLDIEGGVGSDAFTAAGQVMHSLPKSIRSQVTGVSATTPDDVTLSLGGANAKVLWGSAEDSAQKALNLQKIMKARPPESVHVYDVSSPGAVVVR